MSSTSLITKVLALLSPDVVRSAADSAGESRDTMRKLLEGAIPAVLAGLNSQVTSAASATPLLDTLRGGTAGVDLLALVFGPRATGVAEAVAHWAGVKPAVATQSLRTGSELVLKALGDENSKRGFTAETLSGFLGAQQATLLTFLPAPLIDLFGLAPAMPVAAAAGQSVSLLVRAAQALAVAAVFAGVMTCYRSAPAPAPVAVAKPVEVPQPAAPRQVEISLPSGKMLSLLEGSFNYKLVRFLEDKNDRNLPRTFVFDHLNFFTAKTEITPESQPTVADLVAILQAYPETGVRLEGHTDSQGNAAANQKLSEDRAVAIRALLLQQGIAAARMETAGYGQTKPIADNATEEGRAQNRRLELVVVKK